MNQTPAHSLFTSFINPKYYRGIPLAQSAIRKKRHALRGQWLTSSTLSPSLLLCTLFKPSLIFVLLLSLPLSLLSSRPSLQQSKESDYGECSTDSGSGTRLSACALEGDDTCAVHPVTFKWRQVLYGEFVISDPSSPVMCGPCLAVKPHR